LGLVAPALLSAVSWASPSIGVGGSLFRMRAAALRSVFLLCCQVATESVLGRRSALSVPLPVRVLVPVSYNALRLPYLWDWATMATAVPTMTSFSPLVAALRVVGLLNLLYWAVNLFGFLLPVAAMRYLRAHFLAVEAEQVTLRSGMEDTIGLLPPS
jgi:hypothetical protein